MLYLMRSFYFRARLVVEPAPCSVSFPSSQSRQTAFLTSSGVLKRNKAAVVKTRFCADTSGCTYFFFFFSLIQCFLPPSMTCIIGCYYPRRYSCNTHYNPQRKRVKHQQHFKNSPMLDAKNPFVNQLCSLILRSY